MRAIRVTVALVIALIVGTLGAGAGPQAVAASGAPSATASPAPNGQLITKDVVYGHDQGPLLLDVYRPPAIRMRPVMILIHGGGFYGGDKSELASTAAGLERAGYVVFNVNYSLNIERSPGYPRELNDVRNALSWVQVHAASYGGDPSRIGLLGSSAGAYLAAMLGVTADTATARPVKAVVTLSGPVDIERLQRELRVKSHGPCGRKCLTRKASNPFPLQHLTGCRLLKCSVSFLKQLSPIDHVTPQSPPFLLANSTHEVVPASQATVMAKRLRSDGVTAQVQLVPGRAHASAYLSQVRNTIGTFVRSQLPLVVVQPPASSPGTVPVTSSTHHSRVRRLVFGLLVLAVIVAIALLATDRRRHRDSIS